MDNDDAQSLIHAMLYANDMNYVGIINTRTDDGGTFGSKPRDGMKMIDEIIDAYGRDLQNLRAVRSGLSHRRRAAQHRPPGRVRRKVPRPTLGRGQADRVGGAQGVAR